MPSDPTPRPGQQPAKPPRRRPGPGAGGGNWLWLVILLLLVGMFLVNSSNSTSAFKWGDFVRLINDPEDSKAVKRINLRGSGTIVGEVDPNKLKDEDLKKKLANGKFSVQRALLEDPSVAKRINDLASRKKGLDKEDDLGPVEIEQQDDHSGWFVGTLVMVLPAVVLLALFLFLLPRFRDPMGGGFLSNYIKSPAKRYERTKGRITFDDVAGLQNAKGELAEIVEFLRTPEKFARLGAVVPKGVLLVGPPGTGKTLMAKAVAGEAGVPFFSISGSEFIQMFVGVGASRVRDMFKTAKENAPCILFIDEIDAVGRMRGAGVGGGSDEREQTLNQILSEMDGFTPTETVIVMAATNRPDVLDSALLRPGRFDRHVTVEKPTWQGRLAILKVHTRNKPLADDVDLEELSRGLIGMTGADLRNLANEAALLATREGKGKIDRTDFERAADRVLIGAKREEVLTPEEKRRTAYHEAGHALCAWLTPQADPLFKVTIVPRGRSAGVTRFKPDEDRVDYTQTKLTAQLIVTLGGRAADRLVYNEVTSGASMDLKQATRIARLMVAQFGMSERLGPVAFRVGEEHVFLGKELQEPRDFSEGTALVIDQEVQRLLRDADEQALELLRAHRAKVELLVEALLQKEELLREDIDRLLQGGDVNGVPASGITVLGDKRE